MKKLVVTADDYGYTKAINDGIVRAATEGIVTDIAMMVMTDQSDQDHAMDLLKKHKLTHVGLHTCLFKWGKTQRPHREDFVQFFRDASDQIIADKAMDEIRIFEKIFGHSPEFISPQFNMHGNLRLLKVMADYVVEHKIPMRIPRSIILNDEIQGSNYSAEIYLKRLGVKMTDHLFAHILGSSSLAIIDEFTQELSSAVEGQSVEMLIHPGYDDVETFETTSLNFERTRDLAIALDKPFKAQIANLGFTLCHMQDL